MAENKTLKTGTLTRSAVIDRAGFDKEKRTIRVRFSTETPVKRWFGEEILSHDSDAVNLTRINSGAAVLCEHDPNQRCGITESGTITADKNGEAVIRFARTALGEQCLNEIEDGTLRWVSVGYVVNRFEVNDKEDEYRAIDWEPLEISLVGIPADPNARILRNTNNNQHESILMKRTLLLDANPALDNKGGNTSTANTAPAVITQHDYSREMDEGREMLAIAAQYQRTHPEVVEMTRKAIEDKTPIAKYQRAVMELISKESTQRNDFVPTKQSTSGARSVGGKFVESDAYKNIVKRGGISKGNHISVEMPDFYTLRSSQISQRAVTFGLGTSDISSTADIGGTTGAGIDIQQQWNLLGQQPIAIADLFGQATTGGDVVRYIRELSLTNTAARVAEASAIPQLDLDIGVVNATVEKTAAFVDVTREMLNDWGQASSFINGRLAYVLQAKEDSYLLNGTGTNQITGVLNFSGIQNVGGATNTVDQLLRAKAYVEGANGSGFASPDAYVMNPLDFLSVRLSKDTHGQYLFGGPAYAPYGVGGYSNVGQLWGLPVVTSTFLAQGTAICGAFKQAGTIWRRQGVVVETTDSDGSKFLSDIYTIRATSRFVLGLSQPNKFCTITNIPAQN